MGIKLFNSSPYYDQANGQAEASNKIMIKFTQKKIDQKPRRWHSVLNEALWASEWPLTELQKRLLMNWFMGTMQFYLGKYNQILGELFSKKDLSSKDYNGLMMDELEDLHMIRLRALENIEKNKLRVAKYYNRKVKVTQIAEGDLVWKALLPIGIKYSEFGKWSLNWEGPFRVVRCVPGNAEGSDGE
jgi:hypothetical protein